MVYGTVPNGPRRLRLAFGAETLTLATLAATLVATSPVAACPELAVPPATDNTFGELILGATNVNAAVGSGALTATLSRCDELTSLKWPGPFVAELSEP